MTFSRKVSSPLKSQSSVDVTDKSQRESTLKSERDDRKTGRSTTKNNQESMVESSSEEVESSCKSPIERVEPNSLTTFFEKQRAIKNK